jgi:hypothetical protein
VQEGVPTEIRPPLQPIRAEAQRAPQPQSRSNGLRSATWVIRRLCIVRFHDLRGHLPYFVIAAPRGYWTFRVPSTFRRCRDSKHLGSHEWPHLSHRVKRRREPVARRDLSHATPLLLIGYATPLWTSPKVLTAKELHVGVMIDRLKAGDEAFTSHECSRRVRPGARCRPAVPVGA